MYVYIKIICNTSGVCTCMYIQREYVIQQEDAAWRHSTAQLVARANDFIFTLVILFVRTNNM